MPDWAIFKWASMNTTADFPVPSPPWTTSRGSASALMSAACAP
ncbi:Uncharacterised protein [Mycobacteroides abscessus]|nr:Uncharacterised protein [Mycobacteroides abscessus]